MAEAHQAVAFSFTVTNEGVAMNVDREALSAVWRSGIRAWRKHLTRIQNKFHNGIYPARPDGWMTMTMVVFAATIVGYDLSFGLIAQLEGFVRWLFGIHAPQDHMAASFLYAMLLWVGGILLRKYILMSLLGYTRWMYELRGKLTMRTKFWHLAVKLLGGRHPNLYSYQGSMPKLPVPDVKDTMKRYLTSVRPLLNDEGYERMEKLAKEFQDTVAGRLQFYLKLKYWWAPNYVSDWWEEYVYLAGRSSLMVNSNFYAIDAILIKPTRVQTARAANMVHGMIQYMRLLEQEDFRPLLLNEMVPLCSRQYERQFSTVRIPRLEKDCLVHYRESRHIVVYHMGRYYKCYFNHGEKLLEPVDLQKMFQTIVDDKSEPCPGEEKLGALTAGNRDHWAQTRKSFFSRGVNKASIDAIDRAAFVLVLDDAEYDYEPTNPDKLDSYAKSLLHGKGYDRWFDKSFTFIVFKNGRAGFNAEHSWADAPIMAHLWESCLVDDLLGICSEANLLNCGDEPVKLRYTADGNCRGVPSASGPNPTRLQWDITPDCQQAIDISLEVASGIIEDVDLHVMVHDSFGKGFMKTCKVSPDAYIQMALQLAYYRDAGKFCLTYEASMTRLYREGRTETVRSCSVSSCEFVKAIEDREIEKSEKIRLLKAACGVHQNLNRDAMTGKGIDRHLFCLYVISKYLGVESPFLREVLSEPWRLSTSQTPHSQTDKLDLRKHPNFISAGGGFGPVADDGYGVSYIITGEDLIFFHISSKFSCKGTSSKKFAGEIKRALADIREIFL